MHRKLEERRRLDCFAQRRLHVLSLLWSIFHSRFLAVFSAASTQILPQQVSEQDEEGKTALITILLLFYMNTGFIEDLWCQNEQVDFVFVLLWMNLL